MDKEAASVFRALFTASSHCNLKIKDGHEAPDEFISFYAVNLALQEVNAGKAVGIDLIDFTVLDHMTPDEKEAEINR